MRKNQPSSTPEVTKLFPNESKVLISYEIRLSKLLYGYIKRGVPALQEELKIALENAEYDLKEMGEKRGSIEQQRLFLTRIFTEVHALLNSSVRGLYEDNFFGKIKENNDVMEADNGKRLRAVIQYLNIQFEEKMRLRGHEIQILPDDDDEDENYYEDDEDDADKASDVFCGLKKPLEMTQVQAAIWASKVIVRSRGCELPGLFNPLIVNQLFLVQSSRWEEVAKDHILAVWNYCKDFVSKVVGYSTAPDVAAKVITYGVEDALDKALVDALNELKEILEDTKYPSTYNHYFTDTLQKIRHDHLKVKLQEAAKQSAVVVNRYTDGVNSVAETYLDPEKISSLYKNVVQQVDMTKLSAEEAVDALQAYYKVRSFLIHFDIPVLTIL